jgi:HK97 gp10 family phage protein
MILSDFSEVDALARDIGATATEVKRETPKQVSGAAGEVFRAAERDAPVDTGELVEGIYMRPEDGGKAVRIGSDDRQGFFQEFGTSAHPPQPWLFRNADNFPRALTTSLGRIASTLRGGR